MTRICSYCRKEVGEKCPKCGGTDFNVLLSATPPGGQEAEAQLFKCIHCAHTFPKGEGGNTHTICPLCYVKYGRAGKPAILVWRFHEAPPDLQTLSAAGDEEWIAVIPPGVPFPTWAEGGGEFGRCRVEEIKDAEGSTVLIGYHS